MQEHDRGGPAALRLALKALRFAIVLVAAAVASWPAAVTAHDASAWGGLFRSSDGGATWFQASSGKIMGGALSIAVDPADPAHVLLGTDSGLLSTRNGGRDWELLASDVLRGAVLAVAFDSNGTEAIATSASTMAISEDGVRWRSLLLPVGAAPVRAVVPAADPGGFFLLGWIRLFSTSDAGGSWSQRGTELTDPVTQLALDPRDPARMYAIAAGDVLVSADGGRTWQTRESGLPKGGVDVVTFDASRASRLFAGGATRVFCSDDDGATWTAVGSALPESVTHIRGISSATAGDANRIVVSTEAGLYFSRDGGASWSPLVENLPAHIEAGPLVSDSEPAPALYAGFSVTPYEELWRNAASGTSALARLSEAEVAGAAAFVAVLGLAAGLALRWLAGR